MLNEVPPLLIPFPTKIIMNKVMKTRKATSHLPLNRYDKVTSVVQEAAVYPRANVQPEEHSEAKTSTH